MGLGHLATSSLQPAEDFAAFKEKRLKLSSRQKPAFLAAVGDTLFSHGVPAEIKVPEMLLRTGLFINETSQPEIVVTKEVEAVLQNLKLELKEVALPTWDRDKGAFMLIKRYLVYSPAPVHGFNLSKEQSFDLDRDGKEENYSLQDGQLVVSTGSGETWQTPEDWWVENFVFGDANNDGIPDLNLSIWKAGSFGPCKPFWVTGDDNSVKNHLFIFNLVDGSFKPVWQSSNLDQPNYEMVLADIDADGHNELIALEGNYTNPGYRQVSIWKWNGWGFSKLGTNK